MSYLDEVNAIGAFVDRLVSIWGRPPVEAPLAQEALKAAFLEWYKGRSRKPQQPQPQIIPPIHIFQIIGNCLVKGLPRIYDGGLLPFPIILYLIRGWSHALNSQTQINTSIIRDFLLTQSADATGRTLQLPVSVVPPPPETPFGAVSPMWALTHNWTRPLAMDGDSQLWAAYNAWMRIQVAPSTLQSITFDEKLGTNTMTFLQSHPPPPWEDQQTTRNFLSNARSGNITDPVITNYFIKPLNVALSTIT